MANNPQTRMQAFDAMTEEERALGNEYGVNVVTMLKRVGFSGPALREACERHRNSKQAEALHGQA